jgi:hypothetical protein
MVVDWTKFQVSPLLALDGTLHVAKQEIQFFSRTA